MKMFSKILGLTLLGLLISCGHDSITPQQPVNSSVIPSQREGYPTLSYFSTYPNSTLVEAPNGYHAAKSGQWNYTHVYLFTQDGSSEVWEIYKFGDEISFDKATSGNDKDLWEDTSDGKVKCSGPGSLCGGGSGNAIVVPVSLN